MCVAVCALGAMEVCYLLIKVIVPSMVLSASIAAGV